MLFFVQDLLAKRRTERRRREFVSVGVEKAAIF
jgi:hypothetical protein